MDTKETKVMLPVNEGPMPSAPSEFTRFDPKTNPIEFGSLDRSAFSQLGDWHNALMKDGTGISYRVGVKERVKDSEGDLATALIMFWLPISERGMKLDDSAIKALRIKAQYVLEQTVLLSSNDTANLIGALMNPPDYMIEDYLRAAPQTRVVR